MTHAFELTMVTLIVLVIAMPLLSVLTGRRLRTAGIRGAVKYFRYARTIVVLWSLSALAVYALALHGLSPRDVGLRPPHHPIELFAGIVLVLGLLGRSGSRRTLSADYERGVRAVVPESAAQWACFVPVAATAGICEEFLYRGFALSAIASMTGSLAAGVLLSSIAFGLGHAYQGPTGMIGASVIGILFAGLFIVTGSLYPCMLAHFGQDIVGAVVLSRTLRRQGAT